jgi:hypothetical protein
MLKSRKNYNSEDKLTEVTTFEYDYWAW